MDRRTFLTRWQVLPSVLLFFLSTAASPASFTALGFYQARAISADGSVVVGQRSVGAGEEAVRWSALDGTQGLGDLPANSGSPRSDATGVSADGSVVVGTGYYQEAFRWTNVGGMIGLGYLSGSYRSMATGVSANGSVVVGFVGNDFGTQASRWTSSGGMVGLGFLPGGPFSSSRAHAVSSDGTWIVGLSTSASGTQAARWSGGGAIGLGFLSGDFSIAYDVSDDGAVVVGQSTSNSGLQAFRWTSGGGMVGLGNLGVDYSQANGVSADGSVVVGTSDYFGVGRQAFVWTESAGMERLFDVLVSNGAIGLSQWSLEEATGISSDGKWVVGFGTNPDGYTEAFLANITPVPVPAAGWLVAFAFPLLAPWIVGRADPRRSA